jgi:hypothetical protein
MSTHTQNGLEISRTSSRKLTLAAIVMILQVIGIGAGFAQLTGTSRVDDPMEPPAASCTAAVLPHFPLQSGNQWTYAKTNLGGLEQWQVSVVERSETGSTALLGYFGASHTVCSGSGGTVHEVTADTDSTWYNLGGSVGSVWKIKFDPSDGDVPECVDGSSIRIASRTEHVDVAAGSFDNVIRVDYTSPCADAGIIAEWFAPGVGLIKRMEQSFGGPIVSELKSAVVGGLIMPRPALSTSLAVDKAVYSTSGEILPSEDAGPTITANFILSNAGTQASEFDFAGCVNMTVVVYDKSGKARISVPATDGTDCKSAKTVHVTVAGGTLALPSSFALNSFDGSSLENGRYLVVATLNTLDPEPLRPSASATIDIKNAPTDGK